MGAVKVQGNNWEPTGREEIGFSGCLTTLWRQLDHDGSGEAPEGCSSSSSRGLGGSILFSDIDPESAMQLADLKAESPLPLRSTQMHGLGSHPR